MRTRNVEEKILTFLLEKNMQQKKDGNLVGCTTENIAVSLGLLRSNVSAILNKLCRDGRIAKLGGRPVVYVLREDGGDRVWGEEERASFSSLIGNEESLKKPIHQAKAAILYPPNGIHTLILGPTGVGKTMFAELMHRFAIENGVLKIKSPFIEFNCSDYAHNPQLLMGQLFGYKKGAYTGADKDHLGIVAQADGGVLFLDEVHRLPKEGQELLFYLIDKGEYSPLGDSTKKKVNILILCATTEMEDNVLLKTFKRRIPMTIYIPSLQERSLEERFLLIKAFFQKESQQVNKEILVSNEVMKSLLVYHCTGNIGQLKSDIKLACANAFLDSLTSTRKKVSIELKHLPVHVKEGLLYQKEYALNFEKILEGKHSFSFSDKGLGVFHKKQTMDYENNFYGQLKKRLEELNQRHYSEEDIRLIMAAEVEGYFNKYLRNVTDATVEISKIVNERTIKFVEGLLKFAEGELHKVFTARVFHGLCLHMQASLERIRDGKPIMNHKFEEILKKYPEEFRVVHDYCRKTEREYDVKIPMEEICFLTMFLSADKVEYQQKRPLVLIAMHGRSTASSMAEVVNRLLGTQSVLAYDMNLDKSSKVCYEELKFLIQKNHKGADVILLVDMGSLKTFGSLISEECGINLRVVDLVTTAVALEVARKAEVESNIDVICRLVREKITMLLNYGTELFKDFKTESEYVIITLCTTGEGSAVKIKNLIEDNVDMKDQHVEIIPMAINDRQELENRLRKIASQRRILATIGTMDPHFYGIPFISLSELIMFNRYDDIARLVESAHSNGGADIQENLQEIEKQVFDAIKDKLKHVKIREFRNYFNIFIKDIEELLKMEIDRDTLVGLIFHVTCVIDALLDGIQGRKYKNDEDMLRKYADEIDKIKQAVGVFEKNYSLKIGVDEICYILSILKQV